MLRSYVTLLAIAGCGGHGAATPDAARDSAVDAAPDALVACVGTACDLSCGAADTWQALSNGPGTALGDSEPATPSEIGDGMWHLFVGVNTGTGDAPAVFIFDATAAAPTYAFALPADPLVATRDSYDAAGSETPSYFRADPHTEYVYYCAIASTAPLSAGIAAFRRVDGAAWEKIGLVAPAASDELTQCEPNVARDPASGQIVLQYLSLIGDGSRIDERARTSADPESFAGAPTTTIDSDATMAFPNRLAVARDPYAAVWRTAFDTSVGNYTSMTSQTWSAAPNAVAADLALAQTLHDGNHATHLQLHQDFAQCTTTTCPQGAVLQPSKPIFPDSVTVIFFYSGWSDGPDLQVNGQLCHRAS